MMIKKARKKPVVVEYIQYNNLNREEIEEFVGQRLKQELESETAYLAGKGTPKFSITIPTLEGEMKAMPNDYIIKGLLGEFYPCKPDAFALTYEATDTHTTPAGNDCSCTEGASEEELPCEIIINTRPAKWNRSEIEYEEIIDLANVQQDFLYTVSIHYKGGLGRTVIKGEIAKVEKGMIINVANTNNA